MYEWIKTVAAFVFAALFLSACVSPKLQIGQDWQVPLKECVLEGESPQKILVLPITGTITAEDREGLIRTRPGVVREVAAHLQKARLDKDIKALLILVDSPGGTAVASEMLYHELKRYKDETGVKAVSLMLSMAASGGYQAALAGDAILAHPSTITGSVGTIFIRPKVYGLMDKIGVGIDVTTSGRHKDMASPLRPETPEEQLIIQEMIADMNQRFLDLVAERRGLEGRALADVATARIYTAGQAVKAGLIDAVGFQEDALARIRELAGLPEDARVVIYRRSDYPDDNIYNTATAMARVEPALIGPILPDWLDTPSAGFYYLWLPGRGENN